MEIGDYICKFTEKCQGENSCDSSFCNTGFLNHFKRKTENTI